jgi:hypothetical protein
VAVLQVEQHLLERDVSRRALERPCRLLRGRGDVSACERRTDLGHHALDERLDPVRALQRSEVDLESRDANHSGGSCHAVEEAFQLGQGAAAEHRAHELLDLDRVGRRGERYLEDLTIDPVVLDVDHCCSTHGNGVDREHELVADRGVVARTE